MTIEYAKEGVIGVLTPQANTTVEAEFGILLPPRVSMMAARLTSDKKVMNDRLVDYFEGMHGTLDQFANAPIDAIAFACTGSSYFAGLQREELFVQKTKNEKQLTLITATDAIADALQVLDATRIGVVSPYDDALHEQSIKYWNSRNVSVGAIARVTGSQTKFHSIYTLESDVIANEFASLATADAKAIVLLGTGMPSLRTILQSSNTTVPVLSSNICLLWRCVLSVSGQIPTRESLMQWLEGVHWRERWARQIG